MKSDREKDKLKILLMKVKKGKEDRNKHCWSLDYLVFALISGIRFMGVPCDPYVSYLSFITGYGEQSGMGLDRRCRNRQSGNSHMLA